MKKDFHIKEKYREFKAWRERPCQLASMSEEEHDCMACGTHYEGNYCPRCGQSAKIGRYSFKVAMRNFVDVWGLGNRGMFRTIRDLILRPGYMIRDYLKGMQMAYFPPFKMFFLLFALSVFVTHGLNIKGQALYDNDETEYVIQDEKGQKETVDTSAAGLNASDVHKEEDLLSERTKEIMNTFLGKMERFEKRFPSVFMLLMLMLVSDVLYLFFRHCPKIPDLRYSEFFVALVYISNMYSIYSIVFDFFALTRLSSLSILLTLIPLKQLTGYSWWRTILKAFTAVFIMLVLLIVLIVLIVFCIAMGVKRFG